MLATEAALASAHEGKPGNPADQEAKDLSSNEVGRHIAQEGPNAPDEDLAELVEAAVREERTAVIECGNDLPYFERVEAGRTGRAVDLPASGSRPAAPRPRAEPVRSMAVMMAGAALLIGGLAALAAGIGREPPMDDGASTLDAMTAFANEGPLGPTMRLDATTDLEWDRLTAFRSGTTIDLMRAVLGADHRSRPEASSRLTTDSALLVSQQGARS